MSFALRPVAQVSMSLVYDQEERRGEERRGEGRTLTSIFGHFFKKFWNVFFFFSLKVHVGASHVKKVCLHYWGPFLRVILKCILRVVFLLFWHLFFLKILIFFQKKSHIFSKNSHISSLKIPHFFQTFLSKSSEILRPVISEERRRWTSNSFLWKFLKFRHFLQIMFFLKVSKKSQNSDNFTKILTILQKFWQFYKSSESFLLKIKFCLSK